MKKGFVVYKDWIEYTEEMTNEDVGILFKIILLYQNNLDTGEIPYHIRIIWNKIKKSLDEDTDKYNKICEKNKENVSNRWNKNNTTVYDRIPPHTTGYETIPNDTHTDTDININNNISKDIQENSSKEEQAELELSEYGNKDINELIGYFKECCKNVGIVYSSNKDRMFTKHLLSKKFKEEIGDLIGLEQKEAVKRLFLMATVKRFKKATTDNYRHGKILGPYDLYNKRDKILQNYLTLTQK